MEFEHRGAGRRGEPEPSEAKRAARSKTPRSGEGGRGGRQPEPAQVQPLVESAEGNAPAPLAPEQQRKREKKKVYNSRSYQKNRTERLADRKTYREDHKKEIRVYQREYMRDYREGKRRRLQAEQPQPIQVFPEP